MDNDLKTIKSLLLLGASAFCFALTGAGVATYAFFDISEGAKVSHLEFGVDGGGSLLLGLKENLSGDITYYQDVDDETLSRHYPSYSPGASLSPVSSMMRDSWLLPSFDLNAGFPVFYGDYGEYDDPTSPRVARQGYIQFEAYFLSDEEVLDAAARYRRWWESRKYPRTMWTVDPCYDEPLCGSGYMWW